MRAPFKVKPRISICTAVWNGLDFTKRFIESLETNPHLDYELILVDNGSDQEVSDYLKVKADKFFRFETNQGFCKGFNKAVELCSHEHILLTNNDTVWPNEDWQKTLFWQFVLRRRTGLLFPCANHILMPANLRSRKGNKVIKLKKWENFLCSGAAIFTKKTIFEKLQGFDESYGTSGEDLDLQCKAWEAGYEIYVSEKVFVDHLGKASSKRLSNREELWRRNSQKFWARWGSKLKKKSDGADKNEKTGLLLSRG